MDKLRCFLKTCKDFSVQMALWEIDYYHLILWVPLGLSLGIMAFFALPKDPSLLHFALVGGGSSVALVMLFFTKRFLGWPFLVVCLCMGFSLAAFKTHIVQRHVHLLTQSQGHQWWDGVVLEVESTTKGARYMIRVRPANERQAVLNLSKVRLSSRLEQPPIQVGDHVHFLATFLPISGPAVPGGYDFRRQAFFQSLTAVGYLEGKLQVVGQEKSLIHTINDLRSVIRQRIQKHLSGSEGAIATALVTGERVAISPSVNETFNNSGLAHILSISGLHFSILAGLVFFACRRLLSFIEPLAHGYDLKKVAAGVVILVSLLYALMAGGSVPVARSFLMICAAMGAVLMDREPISMPLVALAATCILLVSPEALLTASFQMSFAAVVGLVAFYENWQTKPAVTVSGKLRSVLMGMLLTTVVASLATAPLTLYHFGRVTLYAVLANFLAVPLTAFWIMPSVLLMMILMPFGLEGFIIDLLGVGIEGLLVIAERVAALSYSSIIFPPLPSGNAAGFISLWVIGGLLLCVGPYAWRKVGVGAMACACLFLVGARPYDLLVQQRPFALMMRTGDSHALCVGKVQPYLVEQWSKAMGMDVSQVTCVPLCAQGARGRSPQRCVREPLRLAGIQLPVSSGKMDQEETSLPQAFVRDAQNRFTPVLVQGQERRWMQGVESKKVHKSYPIVPNN